METQKTILLHNISPEDFKKDLIEDFKIEIQNLLKQLKAEKPIEYLTRKEVSKILKVSTITVVDWEKKGILQPYRIGNLIRHKNDEVEMALTKINPPQKLAMK